MFFCFLHLLNICLLFILLPYCIFVYSLFDCQCPFVYFVFCFLCFVFCIFSIFTWIFLAPLLQTSSNSLRVLCPAVVLLPVAVVVVVVARFDCVAARVVVLARAVVPAVLLLLLPVGTVGIAVVHALA